MPCQYEQVFRLPEAPFLLATGFDETDIYLEYLSIHQTAAGIGDGFEAVPFQRYQKHSLALV